MTTSPGQFSADIAVVTGGGGGIGRAIAAALLDGGARVVLNDRRPDVLAEFVALHPNDANLLTVEADVSNREGARSVIDAAVQHFGDPSILVNVSGGMRGAMELPFTQLDDEQWDFAMRINLRTTFECMQAGLEVMIPAGRGRVVNIASTAWGGNPDRPDYAAAKAGVVGLTRSVATQVAPHGVTINAVAPGVTLTDAVRSVYADVTPDVPLGRWNEPEDIAGAVCYLCSNAARNVSGQVLTVAGGTNPSL
jgi:NAD(P)-dependent dehydrogenase (short-subunit alcohol dehydrogenase family)